MNEEECIDLDGVWELRNETGIAIQAIVPGCVHTFLLAAGLIDDPYYGDNELTTLWIGEDQWTFESSFEFFCVLVRAILFRFHHMKERWSSPSSKST